MNDERNSFNSIAKERFLKFHEKVQHKSERLMKRLEKSKSIDVLENLSSNFDYKSDRRFGSGSNLNEMEIEFNYLKKERNDATLESKTPKINYSSYELQTTEAKTIEFPSITSLDSDSEENIENGFIFDKPTFKTSLESLNEVARESDESAETPSTPRSLRDRIGSKINEARKRRQEKKERLKRAKQKELQDKVESFVLSNSTKYDVLRSDSKKYKLATVTVAIIEVTGLDENAEDKPRILICRLRLGSEKKKSKVVKSHKDTIKFQEIFNFNLFEEDSILEVSLWDKDISLGRYETDVCNLKKEKTHKLKISLEDSLANIQLFFLLTVSGTSIEDTVYDMDEKKISETLERSKRKYAWHRIKGPLTDVGYLWILAYGAKGLPSNDWYCVFTLNNESIRTMTDYKTNAPNWMKILSFDITDITSTLEVTVWDEKRSEEVAKVSLPLHNLKSTKKWYALKDSTEKFRAKGNNPRILLETAIIWNVIKASVRVINPKEPNYLETEEKLDRHLLAKNISRCRAILSWILGIFRISKTLFQWESLKLNIVALAMWITFFSYAEVWVIPLLLLAPFVIYNTDRFTDVDLRTKFKRAILPDYDKETKNDKDEKSVSLRQKINSWQEMVQLVQNTLGKIACLGESIKNLYNFSVPFVSYVAIFLIVMAAFVMYFLPFNYICIGWGIHKFTQKILRPNRIPHNEIMDLLSRVPDDDTLVKQEELALESVSEDEDC